MSPDTYQRDPLAQAMANIEKMRGLAIADMDRSETAYAELRRAGIVHGFNQSIAACKAEAEAAKSEAISRNRRERYSDLAIGLIAVGIFAAGVCCAIIALTTKAWL